MRPSIRECGTLLEAALRKVLLQVLAETEVVGDRSDIIAAESRIGKGTRCLQQFGFGELVGVFITANVEDMLRRHFTLNFRKTRRIDWKQATEWRNGAAHERDEAASSRRGDDPVSHDDAVQMSVWTKAFLHDCELIGGSAEDCARAKTHKSGEHESACGKCERDLDADWQYCPQCGTAARVNCHSCERTLKPEWKICPFCETRVAAAGSADDVRARWEYLTICKGARIDGVVNSTERQHLEKLRLELGLDLDEAAEVERSAAPGRAVDYLHKVEDFLVDGLLSLAERRYLDNYREQLGLDESIARAIEASLIPAAAAQVETETPPTQRGVGHDGGFVASA